MVVMDFMCCDPLDKDLASEGSVTTSTTTGDDAILECDYDNQVTKLYHSIEERQWEDVLYFLETGQWYSTNFLMAAFQSPEDPPTVQARTWVTALESDTGNVRWCQLPLHAAVTFLAPFSVIQKLVEVYPKSVRCADDQDMLPLHYAFRFGAADEVVLHLLQKFPQGIAKKAVKDRLPLNLAQYGPRPERGAIADYYIQSAVRSAKKEWDAEYEQMVAGMGMRLEADTHLADQLKNTNAQLDVALAELNHTKSELVSLQQNRQEDVYAGGVTSSTVPLRQTPRSMGSNKSKKNKNKIKNFHIEDDHVETVRAPKQKQRSLPPPSQGVASTKSAPKVGISKNRVEDHSTQNGSRRGIRGIFGKKKVHS